MHKILVLDLVSPKVHSAQEMDEHNLGCVSTPGSSRFTKGSPTMLVPATSGASPDPGPVAWLVEVMPVSRRSIT